METKEILALVLAAFGIILVIGILSMITKKNDTTKEDSVPDITQVTQPEPVYLETDIWDVLNNQLFTTTTSTEQTDANGSAVTAVTGADGSAESTSPDESGATKAVETEVAGVTDTAESGGDGRTAARVAANGADLLVAGTAVFRHPEGMEAGVRAIHAVQDRLDTAL